MRTHAFRTGPAICILAWLACTGADPVKPRPGATVTAVKGSATVTRTDKTTVPAAAGLACAPGDTIAVAPGGRVDLKLGDGNDLRLTGGSTFQVSDSKPKGPAFDLLKGELFAKLKNLGPVGRTTVRTPTGVAGVEGTTFRVHVESTSLATEVTVLDGRVAFAGAKEPDKSVIVGTRQTARSVPWKDAVLLETGTGVPPGPPRKVADDGPAVIAATAAADIPGGPDPAVAEALAQAEARRVALAILTDRLARRRVDGDRTLGEIVLGAEGTVRRLATYAATARIAGSEKTDDGKLRVTLELGLAGLRDVVGAAAKGFTATIREVTRVEYGKAFGGRSRLMAEGAARQDAQRKLVEKIYGVVVDSRTTVKDMATADDTIMTRTRGLLRGSRPVATRYFSDGAVEVDVEVKGSDFVTALDPAHEGKLGIHYLTMPERTALSVFMRFHGFAD